MVDLAATYAENLHLFANVPDRSSDVVCDACLGPVKGFSRCFACNKLFSAAPSVLAERIVPLTSALSPSPWYTRLQNYKTGHGEYAWTLVALLDRYLTAHEGNIAEMLGGTPDAVTIVPSKRPGVSFDSQMLSRVVRAVPDPRGWPLEQLLAFNDGASIPRQTYRPGAFSLVADVAGKRVVLIEDSWVSGATPLSAAGALHDGGASVLVLPIARVVDNPKYWGDHPYIAQMADGYDIERWPS
jgi:hypothetical protein